MLVASVVQPGIVSSVHAIPDDAVLVASVVQFGTTDCVHDDEIETVGVLPAVMHVGTVVSVHDAIMVMVGADDTA